MGEIISRHEYFKRKLKRHSINQPNGCILWGLCTNKDGYGIITYNRKNYLAHRASAFVYFYDFDIESNVQINHKCDTPACINELHLYCGTQKQNIKDCVDRGRKSRHPNAFMTHCIRGHEFTPKNIYKSRNGRQCRQCTLNRSRLY